MSLLASAELTASYYTLTGSPLGEPPRHPLAARAAAAAAAGFSALALSPEELALARTAGRGVGDLAAVVAGHGLEVTEIEPLRGWDEDSSADAEAAIYELAEAFGARQVNAIQVVDAEATAPAIVERFAALCARACERGLRVGIEPRASSPLATPAAAAALITAAGAGNAGIVLDAYHFHRAGLTAGALADVPPSLIASVQLNDMHARPVGTPATDALAHRLIPGAGDIDLAGWLRALDALGVDVPIAVEAMSVELDALPVAEAAARAAAGARGALAAARGG